MHNTVKRFINNQKHHSLKCPLWIMDDIKVAYISTPKVASNAIRKMIRQRQSKLLFQSDDYLQDKIQEILEQRIKKRVKSSQIKVMKDDLYFFSFVRNPLTRLYSCYRDKVYNAQQRRKQCTLSPYGIDFGMSFDDFVFKVAEIPDNQSNDHFRSLHTFLSYEGESFVDHIGKMENFTHDWQPLSDKFSLPCPPYNENSRRVSGPVVASQNLPYSRKSVELAIERYATDIQLYHYEDEVNSLLGNIYK